LNRTDEILSTAHNAGGLWGNYMSFNLNSARSALKPAHRLAFAATTALGLVLATSAWADSAAPADQPVVVNGDKPVGKSTAPSATSPTQRIEPGANSNPAVIGEAPIKASQGFTVPGENPGYLFNLSSYGYDIGHSMAEKGFFVHGAMQNSVVSSVDGGNKHSTEYVHLGYWGFDVDTEKAFGLKGGLFDVTVSTEAGDTNTIDSAIGSKGYVPYAFTNQVRLVNFYYNQSFFDHALQITVGRIESGYTSTPYLSPGIHQAEWYCSFFSVSCGNTNAFSSNSSKAPYDVGSWGGFVTVHPAPNWYVKTGIYENQPLETTSPTHLGFPGRDWGINEANGAFFPLQVGYVTSAAQSLYPTNFHIGAFFDTAPYVDKLYNTKHLLAPTHPGAPYMDDAASGAFMGIQQLVYRFGSDPRSTRGVSLFFSGDWDFGYLESVQEEYAAGVILKGPFAQRAADTINFLVSTQSFDPRQEEDRDLIATAHRLSYTLKHESDIELNYGFVPTPGMTVAPFVQYIINPDQLTLAIPNPNDKHALTLGVRTVLRFDVMLGLPQPRTPL
jgi:porin